MEVKYLNIDNCIILSDVKKIEQESVAKKTKTRRQLSKQIFKAKLMDDSSESSIYTKLYRFEREGYTKEPTDLIDAILKILNVSRVDLIKTRIKES